MKPDFHVDSKGTYIGRTVQLMLDKEAGLMAGQLITRLCIVIVLLVEGTLGISAATASSIDKSNCDPICCRRFEAGPGYEALCVQRMRNCAAWCEIVLRCPNMIIEGSNGSPDIEVNEGSWIKKCGMNSFLFEECGRAEGASVSNSSLCATYYSTCTTYQVSPCTHPSCLEWTTAYCYAQGESGNTGRAQVVQEIPCVEVR